MSALTSLEVENFRCFERLRAPGLTPVWPDNVHHGDLESFVAGIVPRSATLDYAEEASRAAKASYGAEFEDHRDRKAALKVRSVWRDASAAGGYGHLVRNLSYVETPASKTFLEWFSTLYLT